MVRLLRKNGACMALLQSLKTMETDAKRAAGRDAKGASASSPLVYSRWRRGTVAHRTSMLDAFSNERGGN
jgi:hypothetical protein